MGDDLRTYRESGRRSGGRLVIGRKPDNSFGLYQKDAEGELLRMTKTIERIRERLASLQRGAKAGNPIAREFLRRELGLELLPPSAPARCLRCGGKLTDGKCEGRWILGKNARGGAAWVLCEAQWTVGSPDANLVTC